MLSKIPKIIQLYFRISETNIFWGIKEEFTKINLLHNNHSRENIFMFIKNTN